MERSAAADSLFRLPRLSLPLRRPERFRPGAPAVREDPQPVGFGGLVLLPRPSPRLSPLRGEGGTSSSTRSPTLSRSAGEGGFRQVPRFRYLAPLFQVFPALWGIPPDS